MLLLVVMTTQAQTQAGIAGIWRAASVVPDGTSDGAIREFFLELKADGTSVSGTVTGAPIVIREGRIDGSARHVEWRKQQSAGLIHGKPVGRRNRLQRCRADARAVPYGCASSLSCHNAHRQRFGCRPHAAIAETVQRAGREYRRDQRLQGRPCGRLRRCGCRNGHADDDPDDVSGRIDQQTRRGHGFVEGRAGETVLAGSGRQYHSEIVEAAGRRTDEVRSSHAPHADESYVRHGRWFWVPGLRSWDGAAHAAADPRWRPTVESPCRSAGTCRRCRDSNIQAAA